MNRVLDLVAGARPNFMKLAPVVRALRVHADVVPRIVHTGQHYDPAMTDVFFEELGIPAPAVHLDVGSGTHGAQTARILERYEALTGVRPPQAFHAHGYDATNILLNAIEKVRSPATTARSTCPREPCATRSTPRTASRA